MLRRATLLNRWKQSRKFNVLKNFRRLQFVTITDVTKRQNDSRSEFVRKFKKKIFRFFVRTVAEI